MIISRIPSWAKEMIIDRAEVEFSSDYGMCISAFMKEAIEYNELKKKFFNGEVIMHLAKMDDIEQKDDSEKKEVTFGNGKTIKYKGGIKHEQN